MCSRSTKTSGSSNNATVTSNKPCTCGRSSCTTMTASTRSSPSSASPCSSTDLSKPTCAPPSAPTPHCPACCPSTATRSPPPAPCWPPSPTYTPPTPAAGSPSTGSPPSNDSSSPTSTSPYHGPKHSVPQQHPKPQTLTPNYAENGSSASIGRRVSAMPPVSLGESANSGSTLSTFDRLPTRPGAKRRGGPAHSTTS